MFKKINLFAFRFFLLRFFSLNQNDLDVLFSFRLKIAHHLLLIEDKSLSFWDCCWLFFQSFHLHRHKPLAFIIQSVFFYENFFLVNRHVLIPRPETEELVNLVLKNKTSFFEKRLLDLGTGCGNIAISLKKKINSLDLYALDISRKALKMASKNAKKILGLGHGIKWLHVDFYQSSFFNLRLFDIIVSNPPYVATREKQSLDPSVLNYEPHLALFAGIEGLDFYTRLSSIIPSLLKKGGWLYLEIGKGQDKAIVNLFCFFSFHNIMTDINGVKRFFVGKL